MTLRTAIITEKLGTNDALGTTKIALEGLSRGHEICEMLPHEISFLDGSLVSKARIYKGEELGTPQEEITIKLEEMDVIHFRPNPPITMGYLTTLYLLETIKDKVLIINNPEALIRYPEKILPLNYPDFIPPTLICHSTEDIVKFLNTYSEIILKPLYEYSGYGVVKITLAEMDKARFEIDRLLVRSAAPVIAQKFIPEIKYGDKRILLIDGEFAGAFMRVPKEGEYLASISWGGVMEKTTLTAREKTFIERIKPFLKENGIYVCGLDSIGDYITEINITSVAGFTWVYNLYGEKPEAMLWAVIERKLA